MKSDILYVELKTNGHSGPAWIGRGFFSRTWQTVYFNDKVLRKGKGILGNYFDIETFEEYWVSGVKKNGEDRHPNGSGQVHIDRTIVGEYLKIIQQPNLPKGKFVLIDLISEPNKQIAEHIDNLTSKDDEFVERQIDMLEQYSRKK